MYLFSLRRLLKRVIKYGGIAVLVVAVPLTAVSLTLRWQAERALEAKVQELCAQGVPTTAEELDAMYRPAPDIPDAEAAFSEISRFIDNDYQKLTEEQKALLPIMGCAPLCAHTPLPPESLQQLQVTLAALAEPLARAESLLDSGPALFREFEFPIPDIKHYGEIRNLARLMASASLLAAEERDADKVGRTWLRGWRVSEVMRVEPEFTAAFTHSGIEAMMVDNLQKIINRISVPADHLRLWQEALHREGIEARLTRMAHGDIVAMLMNNEMFNRSVIEENAHLFEEFNAPSLTLKMLGQSLYQELSGAWEKSIVASLETLRRVITMGDLPDDKILERLDEMLDGELRATVDMGLMTPNSISNFEMAASFLVGRDYSMKLLAVLACGVELYIAEHGAPPESLGALTEAHVPQAIIDPNTGETFLYERTPQGYVLRSEAAKECGKFDAEEEEDCDNECSLHDLVLEVRRPELAVAAAG